MPKLAVLGHPVSHSRSPAMHNAALAELGLGADWSYEAIDVTAEEFNALLRSLPERGFMGVNVTVPHKLAALAAADEASDAARAIGAANTLTFADRRISAENTDVTGVIGALPRSPDGARALVLGAGGSARAAAWALREAGAKVEVWNRTAEKAKRLAAELGVEHASSAHEDFDVLVNATTVGMAGASEPEPGGRPLDGSGYPDLKVIGLDADWLRAERVVMDLVYGNRETQLIAAARANGAHAVDGLEVLVHQGAAALSGWTGLDAPVDVMRQAARGQVDPR